MMADVPVRGALAACAVEAEAAGATRLLPTDEGVAVMPEVGAGVGCALGDLALPSIGVQVVSVRQVSGRVVAADEPLVLLGGDTLVLSGLPAALALAEAQLLQA
jgi:CPA2 family monovalent cation:H+ antiporter-2